ncbi:MULTISPECIES: HAD-IIA family hydrolase [unclassified Curtobacterium]|uniref:HAD-IIA family hydrolase n=1 Tax=unclassified Curtobacterium TaxID=257496 RepID=UPI0008F23E71|nr:HAD-IIA family hydrolase [Curtobacterium sp. YR515]SFF98898.1 Haloacid Dehalogenase Superfamily Class (subfamily) IIA/haloacid dehalogenase superfamily, subfamily IA, variant 1 with third motif having Dx(3-4)D or Dx(3-4)E [Curtobacterium sp. YR515]
MPKPPTDGVDVVLTDLDGVVYRGRNAIPHAVEALTRASLTARVGYITNNASRRPVDVAEHLERYGLEVSEDDVVTSSQAGVRLLETLVPAGATVLVTGGLGLTSIVEAAGFTVTSSAEDSPAAVIQGFSPDLGWTHLAEASFALADPDVPWVATNMDWSIPVERGIAPGNGTLVSAVHQAVGRMPVVAGKPERPIFDAALARFGGEHPLFIGDRLDTDIKGANDAGIPSVLVLTGIDKAKQVLAADQRSRPTYILGDLRGLSEPYPVTIRREDPDGTRYATVGAVTVAMRGHVVRVLDDGDAIDLLRAGTALIWESGLAIYGLDVDPKLYGGE